MTRNHHQRNEADSLRRFILELRCKRPWYLPALEVSEVQRRIYEALGWNVTRKTIDRHLSWLRRGGYIDTEGPPAVTLTVKLLKRHPSARTKHRLPPSPRGVLPCYRAAYAELRKRMCGSRHCGKAK